MDYYTEISKSYDELHKEEQLKKIEIVKKYLVVKEPLLDIGCGTGVSTSCWDVEKVGIDPSEGLLKKAKCKVLQAGAEDLPFPDNTFGTIVSFTALHHCDIDKAISEIKRVSKEDATFAFSILKKAKNFNEIISKLRKSFGDFKEIDEGKDLILIK